MKKYRNIKTEYKGIIFDSKKESRRYAELELLERAGMIKDLERQKSFELQPGYMNNKGENIRAIHYITDYYYFDIRVGLYVAEDVKSQATRQDKVYRIKKKMFEYKFPSILFIET